MSAIQTRSHVELAARLIDVVGPDRYHRLNEAIAMADAKAIGFALRIVTDAIGNHDRTRDQLFALRDFLLGIAASSAQPSEGAATAMQTYSAQ